MKHYLKTNRFLVFLFLSIGLIGCEKETVNNDDSNLEQFKLSQANNNDGSNLEQFTPEQANWDTFASKPFNTRKKGINKSHAPNDIGWISEEQWENARWDGTTIYDPSKMTREEFYKALFPYPDVLRGLREVYYEHNPFKDVNNPTKAEVDEWHRISINHIRALVGYTSEDRQVKKDHCLFARALWNDERKFTTMWDAKYPGKWGSAYGPCQNSSNGHCGASFVPDAGDRDPYLFVDYDSCKKTGTGAEGIFSASKSNIPWSIKWVRSFGSTLKKEGFGGGHVGPWFHREKFGFSFWDSSVKYNNSIAILRAKWGGTLMPNAYEKP